ncbi:MAG: hypothetical protein KGL43_06320 [Burkholderiales bacterium]|nr:hypothetical protein [Burkholderiales bacterium]
METARNINDAASVPDQGARIIVSGDHIDYAERIVAAHKAVAGALRDAVGHAITAGELLLKAKAEMPHGEFGSWCAALPVSATTARGYMRLARLDPKKRQRVADMPLRAALLEIAAPRPEAATPYIPLGSFGMVSWDDAANTRYWFEVHPVLWPDGKTIGHHYAFAALPENGELTINQSRRPPRLDGVLTLADLARAYKAPLEEFRVFEGSPVLWEANATFEVSHG